MYKILFSGYIQRLVNGFLRGAADIRATALKFPDIISFFFLFFFFFFLPYLRYDSYAPRGRFNQTSGK